MRLLIVRHAIAADHGAPGISSDEERPLTPKGIRRFRQAARGIVRLARPLDAIYASPLVRAAETARLLAEALGATLAPEITAVLAPGHEPAEVVRWLHGLERDTRVALVGHEPGCSHLLSHLISGRSGGPELEFKKGGAAMLELGDWPRSPRAVLLWFANPRLLRLAGR